MHRIPPSTSVSETSCRGIATITRSERSEPPRSPLVFPPPMTQATAPAHSVRFILNTALWLTALGLVVRASGALKEIVFAGAFGVSAATDAFVVAVTYATLAPTVIGAAVGTALIAHLARAHRDGPQALGALR